MDKKLKQYLKKYDWLWENNTPLSFVKKENKKGREK